MVNVHRLIAAISPDVFCNSETKKEVKKIVKEELAKGNTRAYLKAAEVAKPKESVFIYNPDDARGDPTSLWGFKSPTEKHEIEYDSSTKGLEPLYFWTLRFTQRMFPNVEKITDNFISSPGSGHFSDLMGKATRMQEEAMKMLGAANQVIKSILNLIYDLKEFKLLLRTYDDLKSNDPALRNAAMLSLKQRWMDMVDFAKRGTTSLKQLAAQMDYVTIIDAFMTVKSVRDVNDLDLNFRVKKILEQRVADFFRWLDESEKELRKRYRIEISYLRSQVNTVKLYSRWIKPYLKAARKLEQNVTPQAELVTTFNTILLELNLLGTAKYDVDKDVDSGILPEAFKKAKLRNYNSVIILEFRFRGIPQSQGGHWTFGGRTTINFTSYALNDTELKIFKDQVEKDDLGEIMSLIEGATTESLEELQNDIDEFLDEENEEKKRKEDKRKMKEQDVNPFTSLFSFLRADKKEKKKEDELMQPVKADSEYEKIVRSQTILSAKSMCYTVFDIYKRAHGMASHDSPFD